MARPTMDVQVRGTRHRGGTTQTSLELIRLYRICYGGTADLTNLYNTSTPEQYLAA